SNPSPSNSSNTPARTPCHQVISQPSSPTSSPKRPRRSGGGRSRWGGRGKRRSSRGRFCICVRMRHLILRGRIWWWMGGMRSC
ncbi:MAG: hypothetical protein OHK93_003841, partial [Ramalina farinacea]|nr:hypothetical protein [Ramalina farinacea]